MNDYDQIINLIERFASKFPAARQDTELLGVSVSSSDGGKTNIVLNVRESGCEQYRERHNLPASFALEDAANPASAAVNVSIEIKARPVLASPAKPSRRFSAG